MNTDGILGNPGRTLRLVWPQWQGAGADNVAELLPGVPAPRARRGYAVGSRVLSALLPEHAGPTEVVPVGAADITPGQGSTRGIENRPAILASLEAANAVLSRHDPERVLTLGGECSVSVAPFAAMARRYGDDLAVVWIDSHPDCDTPETGYDGYHAMAVSALLGKLDAEVQERVPATVTADRVALAGIHEWVDDAYANVEAWGLTTIGPDELRESSRPLLDWLAGTRASKVAIHLDVDTVDSDGVVLGLGAVPGGLTTGQVRRVVQDIADNHDVVALTVAEFIPRTVLAVAELVDGLPLVGPVPVEPPFTA